MDKGYALDRSTPDRCLHHSRNWKHDRLYCSSIDWCPGHVLRVFDESHKSQVVSCNQRRFSSHSHWHICIADQALRRATRRQGDSMQTMRSYIARIISAPMYGVWRANMSATRSRGRRIIKWIMLVLTLQLSVAAEWELIIMAPQLTLWKFLLPMSILTAWVWYADRSFADGCCRNCGYDLRGNVSGVCPECGVVI
jgi:hypothetical protein